MDEETIFNSDIELILREAGLKQSAPMQNGAGGNDQSMSYLMCSENVNNVDSRVVLEKAGSQDETNNFDFENQVAADYYDEDEDDEFECDTDKYVLFEDKLAFSERLKNCSRECLTDVTKLIIEQQPLAVDDFGNNRYQLKVDMIERDVFEKCIKIMDVYK